MSESIPCPECSSKATFKMSECVSQYYDGVEYRCESCGNGFSEGIWELEFTAIPIEDLEELAQEWMDNYHTNGFAEMSDKAVEDCVSDLKALIRDYENE